MKVWSGRGRVSSPAWRGGWAVLALFLLACGGRQPAPPAAEHPATSVEVLRAMEARLDGVERLRMRAVVEVYGEEGRARVRQVLVAERPDRLRAETLSPFDAPLSVLVANERELVLWDVGAERFYRGLPTARNVARVVPIRLAPPDLVRVLLGGPPVEAEGLPESEEAPRWDGRRGGWAFELSLGDGSRLALVVSHGSWMLQRAVLRGEDGELLWELRTGDARVVEGEGATIEVPGRFRFLMPAEGVDLSLSLERVDLNPVFPPFLFELDPPRGVEVTPL